jgi:hypothetical protein
MSSPNSALERNVRRICTKLRSIAQLDFGDKWNSTTKQAEADTPMNKLWRTAWYWKEGKDNSVTDFKIIFEEAYTVVFELLNIYPLADTSYRSQLAIWIRDLTEQVADTKMAMVRQKGTYSGYAKTEEELDEIIKYISKTGEQVAARVKKEGVILPSHIPMESVSPGRLNPVHIPVAKSPPKEETVVKSPPATSPKEETVLKSPPATSPTEKDNISDSDPINVEFDDFGSEEDGEAF